ncbi:MAG: 3-hydroxyacyl-CoA dehydrogenase NAD-binding domain-containing protein, partial [bacterium]
MKFEKIGIVGFGQMGSGIAQVTAAAGYPVIVSDADQKFLDAGLARIGKLLDRAIEKGKATAEDKEQLLARITTTTNVKDFADCDLVIE